MYAIINNLFVIYTMQFGHNQYTVKMCWQTHTQLCQNSTDMFNAKQYYPLIRLIPILTSTTFPVVILPHRSLQHLLCFLRILFFSDLDFQKWNQKKWAFWATHLTADWKVIIAQNSRCHSTMYFYYFKYVVSRVAYM